MSTAEPIPTSFATTWRALERPTQLNVRRTVRAGRAMAEPADAALAAAWAAFLRSKAWWRAFWVWFAPGVLLALAVGSRIHPVVVGVVLTLAAQAVVVRRNTAKAERLNRERAAMPA